MKGNCGDENSANANSEHYDPHTYWQNRGTAYTAEDDKVKAELGALADWLRDKRPGTLLDVGSGWGRSYLALHHLVNQYTMVDFVESMRIGCAEETGIMPDEWDGITLPYADNSFDAVLSFDVLLHVPPLDIQHMFMEHVRVTSGWMVVAANGIVWNPLATHCFWHDYLHLASKAKLKLHKIGLFRAGFRIHYIFYKPQ